MRFVLYTGLVLAVTTLAPAAVDVAHAHGTGRHILGTIEDIDGSTWKVRARDGDLVTVTVGSDTRMETVGGKPLAAPPRPGDRVAIDVSRDGSSLRATRVRAAPAPRPGPGGHTHAGHDDASHEDRHLEGAHGH